jgi:hypothetical protein
MSAQLEQTIQSLEQVQQIDAREVGRAETLGSVFELTGAVPYLSKTIDLFREIPPSALQEFGEPQRNLIKDYADATIRVYGRLMGFDPSTGNPAEQRHILLTEASQNFDNVFSHLFPMIAYLNSRKLEASEATRAAEEVLAELKRIASEGASSAKSLEGEAKRVLDEVRKTAAESGVSQQANYFGLESDRHERLAEKWQLYTVAAACALAAFALISLFISLRWPALNIYQSVQIGLSKVLIFSTIAFLVFLSSRTLLAHRHNAVVNKHRQNALLTFNALAGATGDTQTREVILTHASACIYAPQETGFGKSGGSAPTSPMIDVLPRMLSHQANA